MAIKLRPEQFDALSKMRNGCILNGDVGSGKSITSLSYYYILNGGSYDSLSGKSYSPMRNPPMDLYIITTARKRDTLEWDGEVIPFLLSTDPNTNFYQNKVVVDSWNNISKYVDVSNAFFIFDEQRVVGYGTWTKSFLKITNKNQWILLSATPGDTWQDYIPVFIANGFYKNKTEFVRNHIVYDHHITKFPKIDHYVNVGRLTQLRERILITMDDTRKTIPHHIRIDVDYDKELYRAVTKTRKNPFVGGYIPSQPSLEALLIGRDIELKDVTPILDGWDYIPKQGDYVRFEYAPITNASNYCYILRQVVNTHLDRSEAVYRIALKHRKAIIFYNFDYELKILQNIAFPDDFEVAEWNGHKHQEIPKGEKWVYFVQYTAGCEGWNCIDTNAIIFYSHNYSYKVVAQASGRINRINTPYVDLYYYHLCSKSNIDRSIEKALSDKKQFNVRKFAKFTTPIMKETK